MTTERALRFAFFALLVLMVLIRSYFAFRVRRAGERLLPDRAALQREGWAIFSMRILLLASVALLIFHPTWFRKLVFPLPPWLRWAAFALGLASLVLLAWTHVELGRLWSGQLQLRQGHRLVTCGPYRRIRHPMYTAFFGWAASLGFVIANWAPVLVAAGFVAFLVARTPREEQMMLERFGDEYRDYMNRTGRFFPRWRTSSRPAKISGAA
ncbi:MAG: isoprenylcysteine carboxylmethyltransferase family protein [Tepidisphaeraceae bacterium]